MKNRLLFLLTLVWVTTEYLFRVESSSVGGPSKPQGAASELPARGPDDLKSKVLEKKTVHYINFYENVLEGRTSSWNRFIKLVVESARRGLGWQSALLSVVEDYYDNNQPQFNRCNDRFLHELKDENDFHVPSDVPVHLPIEIKDARSMSNYRRYPNTGLIESMAMSNFPRVKSFKKKMVLLTSEPYQRMMSFAIEQCMLPSIWYLELVHCMYFGMAPKFSGMILSYSMQDVVGAAFMSIGYKDGHFHLENCYQAVSLVVDDQISRYYKEICASVSTCLESRNFETSFYKQKREFETRMENAYSQIAAKPGFLTPMQLYRYAALLSMSLIKDKSIDLKLYPERNFLPIRIALTSLAYYAISNSLSWQFESERKVTVFFTKTILKMLFEVSLVSIPMCRNRISKFSGDIAEDNRTLIEMFCKEILSAGFILEAICDLNVDNELHSRAIMPQRILDLSYNLFVPDMTIDMDVSKYDTSWIYAHFDTTAPTFQKPTGIQKAYRSRKLEKTIKKASLKDGGIRPQTSEITSVGNVRAGGLTKVGFKIFTKKLTNKKRRGK